MAPWELLHKVIVCGARAYRGLPSITAEIGDIANFWTPPQPRLIFLTLSQRVDEVAVA